MAQAEGNPLPVVKSECPLREPVLGSSKNNMLAIWLMS